MDAIAQLAERTGVDETALRNQMQYLITKACENPELFQQDPKMFIEMGVRAYTKGYVEFCSELLYGTSERARNMRSKLAADVYFQIKQGA